MGRKQIDYSGEIINGLKLNKRINDYFPPGGGRGLARYNCTCRICNKNIDIALEAIKKRKYNGCGCIYKKSLKESRPNRQRNITNSRFGYCVAKYRLDNGNWMCLCDCGKWFSTSLSHLTTGHTKSCGCYRIENTRRMKMVDLTNQKNNMLTAKKPLYSKVHPNGSTDVMWLCQCDCGMQTIISAHEFISGDIKSCGCLAASKRELEIRAYLKEHNINTKTEYVFEDLRLINHLRYDFAILDSDNNLVCLIEHYGIQHYKDGSTIGFGKQQREVTDKIKQDYCKEHNIPLYIISYKENIKDRLNAILAELHVNTVPSSQEIA